MAVHTLEAIEGQRLEYGDASSFRGIAQYCVSAAYSDAAWLLEG